MPTLYLLRHAKSDWSDPSLADRDRPLAGRGRRAAAAMAEHVRSAKVLPALVLCSPAKRTRQTVEAVLPDAAVEYEDDLYGADVDELISRLRRLPSSVASAMVVAHNPGLHELVERLTGVEVEKFPTGALATLAVDDWATLGDRPVELRDIVRPRDLP
jgi:phosphohistidine phosphatase